MDNPCRQCTYETGRKVGCHSSCEKYIESHIKNEQRKKEISKLKENEAIYLTYKAQIIGRIKKGTFRKSQ